MKTSNWMLALFLAAAIAVVALLGVMGTSIAGLSLERAIAREATLDAVLQAGPAGYDALVPRLADSAEAVKPGPDLAARVAAERIAMRARLSAEAAEAGLRLRVMIMVAGLMAALFGAALLGVGRQAR